MYRSREERTKPYELLHSSNPDTLPVSLSIVKLDKRVVCGCTGPDGGVTQLDLHSDSISTSQCVAGISKWNTPCDYVYGISLSLYEDSHTTHVVDGTPHTSHRVIGDPVADVYGAVVRSNSAVLAIADGVSWGKKPRLAARCAVRTALEYTSIAIDNINKAPNSATIYGVLKRSLLACHECILENKATLTTLSVALVCPLGGVDTEGGAGWGVFVASVGDSPVFLYSSKEATSFELTVGSNPADGIRNPKNSGGALGPAIGTHPDLENLSYSFISVSHGDILMLMTDGMSDNLLFLQPKTGSFIAPPTRSLPVSVTPLCDSITPLLSRIERDQLSAQTVAATLMNSVVEATDERRRFNSQCNKDGIEVKRRARVDEEFAKTVRSMSGKLDHASILTYQIGRK